jgi:antitoxin component YwqK of YwqJK toxin-antitoxin module
MKKHLYIILFILPLIGFGQTEYIKEYQSESEIKCEGEYLNNQRHGLWKCYDEQGRQTSEGFYDNGTGESITFHENGKISSKGYEVKGVEEGMMYFYYPSGKLEFEMYFKFGNTEFSKRYYESGQTMSEQNFYNDPENDIFECPYGFQRHWYENGQLMSEQNWVLHPEDECVPHGLQLEWYENGQLRQEENYNNGVFLSKLSWFPNGMRK